MPPLSRQTIHQWNKTKKQPKTRLLDRTPRNGPANKLQRQQPPKRCLHTQLQRMRPRRGRELEPPPGHSTHNATDLEKAGFVDIHEKHYRCPIGPWARDATLKEAGRLHYHHWATGMEGWAMFMLTKWGCRSLGLKRRCRFLLLRCGRS